MTPSSGQPAGAPDHRAARRPMIAGNWKCHKNHLEAVQLAQSIAWQLDDTDLREVEVVVCPPFTALRSITTFVDADDVAIAVGAQDCSQHAQGPYTGEIAADMIGKLGCRFVIVGHSERRRYFQEDDVLVAAKARAALANKLCPIVCVGETLLEREADETAAVVARQVRGSLADVSAEEVASLVIAYEPVWAIGTGRAATADDAQETCALVRATVAEVFGAAAAASVRVLYGGSMNAANTSVLLSQPDIDGGLVGGASLDGDQFARIVKLTRASVLAQA